MTGGIRGLWFLAAIVNLLSLTAWARAEEPAKKCSLARVTQLPLSESGGWFTVPVSINDNPVIMVIDTGAAHSAISPDLAKRLHLPQDRHKKIIVHGVGGDMKVAHPVIAHSFRAGDGHLVDYDLAVANIASLSGKGKPGTPEGLLGIDLLSYYELEFDFPNRTLTLYTSDDCSGNFVPWAGPFDVIAGKRQLDGHLFIPVRLNGEAINALIDTGSTRSSIGIDTAHDVGVSEEDLRPDRVTVSVGANGIPVSAHEHHFDSFTVGQATFRGSPLFVQDERFGVVQMLLGTDFLRRRKLWLSYRTEQAFLQLPPAALGQHPAP